MLKEAADAARGWGGVTEWPDRADEEGFVAALLGGGDGRLAIDPGSGTSKYLCPPVPAPHLVCASSCTASPVSGSGFAAAELVWREIRGAETQRIGAQRLAAQAETVRARLLGHFGVASLAEAILCPSGTDALQVATGLLAAERPGVPITAILPNAAETGSGVPAAVAAAADTGTIEVALRDDTGAPLPRTMLDAAFAEAAGAAQGAGRRPVIYLTYGTKTGLIAPARPPQGADVIVDACQGRILPARVAAFLRRGWPVVVTGSKFFGGPAFSGAVLFPRDRGAAVGHAPAPCAPGVVLRWVAALDGMQRFARAGAAVQEALVEQGRAIRRGIVNIPSLVKVAGLPEDGGTWDERASIFTFAVRDPADGRRLLTAAALRPLYQRLAGAGVLLGQPVGLGAFGGLRIAIGARDVSGPAPDHLPRLFDTLAELTAPLPAGGR
jgi:hypothetical protein